MNILQMRNFMTIAQLENIARASELLHVSQSCLSKNLSRLEEELGLPLFDRNGKHLVLNAAGERFSGFCTSTLHELELVRDDLSFLAGGTDAKLHIGLAGQQHVLLPALTEFRTLHPEAEYMINTAIESDEHLDINLYDVLVYPEDARFAKFNGFPFSQEQLYLAVPSHHALSEKAAIRRESLEHERVVFMRIANKLPENAYRVCTALSVPFASVSFVDSRELHREMIANALAIGFVPEDAAPFYRENKNIRLIPVVDGRFHRNMRICFKREKHLSALAREFSDFLKKYFALDAALPGSGN